MELHVPGCGLHVEVRGDGVDGSIRQTNTGIVYREQGKCLLLDVFDMSVVSFSSYSILFFDVLLDVFTGERLGLSISRCGPGLRPTPSKRPLEPSKVHPKP